MQKKQGEILKKRIRMERIQMLYANSAVVNYSVVIVALAFVFIFWDTQSKEVLLGWFGSITILSMMRAYMAYRFYKASPDVDSILSWGWTFAFASFLSGISWGVLAWFALDFNSVFHTLIVITTLFAMTAGALGSNAVFLPAYLSFALPVYVLLLARLSMESGEVVSTGGLALLFIVIFIGFSRRHSHFIGESIYQRFENIELIQDLEVKNAEAEKANADKSRFLASASHDLRQPIHAMDLFANALEQELHTPKQKVLLSKMRASVDAMSNLLNTLLDLSKLEAGLVQVERTTFLLAPLFERLKEDFLPLAAHKGLSFKVHFDSEKVATLAIDSDPILLENILRNLLSNAIKYTAKGYVSLGCLEQEDTCFITVEDSGIGIAESEQTRVFDEFYQVDNPERDRSKGIGLGLSIVKRLCTLLGHHVMMQSSIGQGTHFQITVAKAALVEHPEPVLENNENLTMTVLVIDDEQSILDGMQAMLEGWGWQALLCQSVEQALVLLESSPSIDLIVSDYRLQGQESGSNAILSVRKALQQPNLPGIIITGDTHPARMKEIKGAGFEVLHKPVKPMQMRAVMQHLMTQAKS